MTAAVLPRLNYKDNNTKTKNIFQHKHIFWNYDYLTERRTVCAKKKNPEESTSMISWDNLK